MRAIGQDYPRKPRRRRRFRPLRRMLLLLIVALMIYGLVNLGMWALNKAFAPRLGFVHAELVPGELSFAGTAVVIRNEIVVVAPKAGTLNLLVEEFTQVKTTQPVLELVDKPLLTAVDKQLADEKKRLSEHASQSEGYVADKATKLAQALIEFRSLSIAYGQSLKEDNARDSVAVFRQLERAAKNVDKVQHEYLLASSGVEQFESRQAILLEQRQSAVFPVLASIDGTVVFSIDSLGSVLRLSGLEDLRLDFVRTIRDETVILTNGANIAAGQPVYSIVDPDRVTLVTIVEGGPRPELEVTFELLVNEQILDASFMRRQSTNEEGVYLYSYSVTSAPKDLLHKRLVTVGIRSLGEHTVSIPKKAIVRINGVDVVYGVNLLGVVEGYGVTVREMKGNRAHVLGLKPGQEIISTPRLVSPGDTLDERGPGGGPSN